MRHTPFALLALGLSLVACRDTSGGDDVIVDGPPDTGTAGTRIQDVQSEMMAVGTAVSLKGVVVTAIDTFGNFTGDFWVQDLAGGPFSGVKVFRPPLDQVVGLQVGDLIDIDGAVKDEFAQASDTSGRKLTELKSGGAMMITKRGTGTVPAPMIVDVAAISLLDKAGRDAEWEKWEGVLITVKNARQVGAQRMFGAAPDQREFRVSGGARIQSAMIDLPAANAFGVCYESITGVGDYVFNDLVFPRSAADVVADGTGCRPLAMNVVATQTGNKPEAATLMNVFVTARDDIGTNKGIWVADSLTAEVNNGVYVFTGNTLAANLTIGAVVNVQGTIDEFDVSVGGMPPMGDTVTEVTGATPMLVAAPGGGLPTPIVVDPSVLSDIGAPGEAYEGVLVQVDAVKVTAVGMFNQFELTANSGAKIVMDNESFTLPAAPTVGTCYSSVTGVMHVDLNANIRTINPRQASDLVIGTGCN